MEIARAHFAGRVIFAAELEPLGIVRDPGDEPDVQIGGAVMMGGLDVELAVRIYDAVDLAILEGIRAAGALLAQRGYVDETYADAMVEREKLVSTYMGMGVAIPHGTSQKKGTVKKSGVVLLQYPEGVDFGDEKAYLVFGIAGVGNDHLDLLGNVCEILEDEDALEQLKKTTDMNYVLEHLQ